MGQLRHKILMTDTGVELMVHKIQRLSRESQNVMKLAAVLGNKFSASTLASVMGGPYPILLSPYVCLFKLVLMEGFDFCLWELWQGKESLKLCTG